MNQYLMLTVTCFSVGALNLYMAHTAAKGKLYAAASKFFGLSQLWCIAAMIITALSIK